VIKVNGSGYFYGELGNATRFVVDLDEMSALMGDGSVTSSLVSVNLVGRRGRKVYSISPLSSSSYVKAVARARERGVDVVKVVIEDFHNESDVIDLTRFGDRVYSIYSLDGVSVSVPPVVLLLSQWPVRMTVELKSVSSMSTLSGQNFLFSSSSEGSSAEGEGREVVGSTLIIVVVCVVVGFMMLSGGFYYYLIHHSLKNKKLRVKEAISRQSIIRPDIVSITVDGGNNEIRASAIVDLDGKKEKVLSPDNPKLSSTMGLDLAFDDDFDLSAFSLSELSEEDDSLLEGEEGV
jgi:hypothetical protein